MTVGPLVAAGLFALSGVALPLALNGLSFLIAAAVMAPSRSDVRREPSGARTPPGRGCGRVWPRPSRPPESRR